MSLAGYSIAGDEETRFAALFPDRVEKLVYLDAAYDCKSGIELASKPAYPMPLPKFEGPIGETVKGASAADPDYTKVSAPALAFYVIYETPQVPPRYGSVHRVETHRRLAHLRRSRFCTPRSIASVAR